MNLFKSSNKPVQGSSVNSKKDKYKESPKIKVIIRKLEVKDKEKILEAGRDKWLVTSKQIPLRLVADFSAEANETRQS